MRSLRPLEVLSKADPRMRSYHYFRKKSKLAVGGSGGRRSIINFATGLRDLNPLNHSG